MTYEDIRQRIHSGVIRFEESFGIYREKNDKFISLDDSFSIEHMYSEYCYCLYWHCKWDKNYSFFTVRVYHYSSVDGNYIFYISPFLKNDKVYMAKKEVPVHVNRLGLVKGQLSIAPPTEEERKEELSNWVKYKGKWVMKDQVPGLEKEVEKPVKEVKQKAVTRKRDDEMINNTDSPALSEKFLGPKICSRIWTLSMASETGWGWYLMEDGSWYVRPIDISQKEIEISLDDNTENEAQDGNSWKKQYDRGGVFLTNAYYSCDFAKLNNEILEHNRLVSLYKEYGKGTEATLIVNSLIDSFLINWKKF